MSKPEADGCVWGHGQDKGSGACVIAGSDPAPDLHFTEHDLDPLVPLVSAFAVADGLAT